jgi:hypothetical protein
METNFNELHQAVESQADEARLGLGSHISNTLRSGYENIRRNLRTYAAIGASAFALGGVSAELAFNAEPVGADTGNVPTSTTPTQQECSIQADLVMPKVADAVMIHAGVKPTLKNRGYDQQFTGALFTYTAISTACNVKRLAGSALEEQDPTNHHRWTKTPPFGGFGYFSGYNSNSAGTVNGHYSPSYHSREEDWYPCTPGAGTTGVRLVDTVIIKDPQTHQTLGEKKQIVPVKVKGAC